MEKEIWKEVVGYEGLYAISSEGRVKRLAHSHIDSLGRHRLFEEKILSVQIGKTTGYPRVNLSKNGETKTCNVHSLIADAFIPNPDNLPCINHIDENRSNSVLSNLERCSYAYNNSYGTARDKRRDSLRHYFEKNGLEMKSLSNDVLLSVIQYTRKGEVVGFFKGGYPEIKEKLGYGPAVASCLCHKNKTAFGYVWRYVGDVFSYSERTYTITKKVGDATRSHQKYVILIDENGEELERYKSVSEAARIHGFDRHYFSRKIPAGGIITIDGKRFVVEKKENEYIPKGHKGPRPDLFGKGVKAVCQYTKDGRFIQKFTSLKEAAESVGVPKSAPEISNCCNGKLKTARGYIWAFEGKEPRTFKNESIRPVAQYAINGEYIATYDSIIQAAKAVNGRPGSIQNNVSGRSHSAYGFVWKYTKE